MQPNRTFSAETRDLTTIQLTANAATISAVALSIEPTGGHVVARIGTLTIADTTRALTLREANYPPVQYIPLEDVDRTRLADSATETYCPYKGDASYYDIITTAGLQPRVIMTGLQSLQTLSIVAARFSRAME